MKKQITYICLSFLCIMFVVSILPSSNNNDENKTTYENLAKETVSLIKRSIEAGVPEKLPKSLEKLMSKREITKYNAGELRYTGMAFIEYPLMKYQNRSLYKDLKKFWETDRKILARSVPYLELLYKEEKDSEVKDIIIDTINEIVGPDSGDLTFLETTLLNLYEFENDENRKMWLFQNLKSIHLSSGPFDLTRWKSLVKKYSEECNKDRLGEAVYGITEISEKNKCITDVFNFLLNISKTTTCKEATDLVLCAKTETVEQSNIQDSLFIKELKDGLSNGGDSPDTLFYIGKNHESGCKRVIPYLIKGLDALHEVTVASAIITLHECTGLPKESSLLPYDYEMAIDSEWRNYAGNVSDVEDPNSLDKKRKQNLIERQKAVVYWKAWWNEHKKDYPEEMVKFVDDYTYSKLVPQFIDNLDAKDKRKRSKAIAFLQKILKIKDTELPYKVTLATYYNDVREPTTNESEQQYLTHEFFGYSPLGGDDAKQMKEAERRASEYISEHEKAIKFWKAWWEIHKKEYQEDNK